MGSRYICVKGRTRSQIALWEGRMFHLHLWEREGPSYLEEVQMTPELHLRQRRSSQEEERLRI